MAHVIILASFWGGDEKEGVEVPSAKVKSLHNTAFAMHWIEWHRVATTGSSWSLGNSWINHIFPDAWQWQHWVKTWTFAYPLHVELMVLLILDSTFIS